VSTSLATFIGNADAVRHFAESELEGSGVHAYLLTGPAHVGKRSLALLFAALATCPTPQDGDACGLCRSCASVARGTHPDIHLVERRDDKRTIIVEQAQEVARIAAIRPYQSDCKVVVIIDADVFEKEAANLLLKTIEEPSSDTRIVLTSGDSDLILPTIRSRCREIALRAVPGKVIADALISRGTHADHANLVARLAAGCPGWALSAINDPASLDVRTTHLDLLATILKTRQFARLPLADRLDESRNLARTREVMASAFLTWIRWWRDALVVRAGCAELASSIDRMDELHVVARQLDVAAITAAIARSGLAVSHLDDNVNPRLALEGLLLDLPHVDGA
jgi:DNA polymerase-3 subunit delta'